MAFIWNACHFVPKHIREKAIIYSPSDTHQHDMASTFQEKGFLYLSGILDSSLVTLFDYRPVKKCHFPTGRTSQDKIIIQPKLINTVQLLLQVKNVKFLQSVLDTDYNVIPKQLQTQLYLNNREHLLCYVCLTKSRQLRVEDQSTGKISHLVLQAGNVLFVRPNHKVSLLGDFICCIYCCATPQILPDWHTLKAIHNQVIDEAYLDLFCQDLSHSEKDLLQIHNTKTSSHLNLKQSLANIDWLRII